MRINNFVPNQRIFEEIIPTNNKVNDSKGNSENFLDMLKKNLEEVNDKQIFADDMSNKYLRGEDVEIHDVMISEEEAKLSLQMAVQIRNKLVEAYQELNRMQL